MIAERAIAMLQHKLTGDRMPNIGGKMPASMRAILSAGLMVVGLRRKGVLGGLLATTGGAWLFREVSDWLSQRQAGAFDESGRPPARGLPGSTDASVGWAPESGESTTGRTLQAADVSGVTGQDEAFAPESGDRILSRAGDQSGPGVAEFEETAEAQRVLEGSQESFPASDAPSWTPGRV